MFSLLLKELTFIFYLLSLELALCCVAALKTAPYIVHSAVYIFLLVLGDQRKYSEKSEICIYLDPCIHYLAPIWINISLFIGCLVETRNYSILSLAFIASSFRVTEDNLVFETVQLRLLIIMTL